MARTARQCFAARSTERASSIYLVHVSDLLARAEDCAGRVGGIVGTQRTVSVAVGNQEAAALLASRSYAIVNISARRGRRVGSPAPDIDEAIRDESIELHTKRPGRELALRIARDGVPNKEGYRRLVLRQTRGNSSQRALMAVC